MNQSAVPYKTLKLAVISELNKDRSGYTLGLQAENCVASHFAWKSLIPGRACCIFLRASFWMSYTMHDNKREEDLM